MSRDLATEGNTLARRLIVPVVLAVALCGTLLAGGVAGSQDRPAHWSGVAARSVTPARPTSVSGTVVVMGDSVAAGTGCDCDGFGLLLARRLGAVTGLRRYGQDGLTASRLARDLAGPSVMTSDLRSAAVVTVTIGANDFDAALAEGTNCDGARCFSSDLAQLSSTLPTLLQRVRALAPPRARVLVMGYWNVFLDGAVGRRHGPTYVATSDALTRKVNQQIAAAANGAGATYIDLYGSFKGAGDRDDTALLAPDGDHPGPAGQALIAHLLAQALVDG
ncbi:MAG: ypmR-like uncharacterized protein [Frankiales bacterium]|nr:ypmR-like uncharacterized protein [Frankiales bacterium]